MTVRNLCNRVRRWCRRRKEKPLPRVHLTHLAPLDNAFDCSKPQSTSADERLKAPPLPDADLYYRYLRRALADPHVCNIALAGHFGCGKSTILRTYEKHYADGCRFLNISLATFGDDQHSSHSDGNHSPPSGDPSEGSGNGQAPSPATEPRRQNHLVEHSILQQLFYQVPKSRIPRSRFKRIAKPRRFWPWALFLFWLLSVNAAIALFRPATFVNAKLLHQFITATTGSANNLLTVGALSAFALPVIMAFHKLRSLTLRKLNLKNCEIEIAEEKDPSALNKHLDEILYFFEATDFDVVVLEDLDRFGTTDVFTKLREINTLVNRNIRARRPFWRRWLGCATRRIVFIYAIRDDMFTGEERTKFFDLVIPVIPVVNHTNSRDLLTKALRSRGLDDIGDELMNDVATFVRDMRLLHNVVNEYTVYRRRLSMEGLDPEKLFAMILYKNVCPGDFAKLHDSDGELHKCIGSKTTLFEEAAGGLRAEQERLKSEMADADRQKLASVRELRAVYLFELRKQVRWDWGEDVRLERAMHPWNSLDGDEQFALLMRMDGRTQSSRGYQFEVSFPKAEKAVDPERTYAEREELILSREGRKREQLERKREQLEDRVGELRHAKLQELLVVVGARALPQGIPQVISAMLRKGYIDETYLSYLSYFYEGALSNSDWVFVQGVKTGQTFDLDYALDNVSEIVERNLGSDEAVSLASKSIYILHYFAEKGADAFRSVVAQLERDHAAAVELVTLFLERHDGDASVLIRVLYQCWPEFWTAVTEHEELSATEWKRHVEALVSHVPASQLKVVCEQTELREGIAGDGRFLPLAESLRDTERVVGFLDAVRPRFRELPELGGTSGLARFIYDHGLYEVTPHNVRLLHALFVGPLPDDLPPSVTHLREQDNCPLAERVEGLLQPYVDILIRSDGALLREREPTVVSLLNDERLSQETVVTLAGGRCVPVESVKTIDSTELWSLLIKHRSAVPTWDNVLAYHQECAGGNLDEVLINYLSEDAVVAKLSQRRNAALFTDGEGPGLDVMGQILACQRIPTPRVGELLLALPQGVCFDDASTIADEHLAVAYPWADLSPDNYEHIRTHAAGCIGEYVKRSLEDFYSWLSELDISGKELASILSAHPRKKKKREIASVVWPHVISDSLSPVAGDLCELMFDDEAFAEAFEPDALTEIIGSVRDRTTKIQALTRFMGQLTQEGIYDVLRSTGHPYLGIATHGKRPLLPKGKLNSELATALEETGLISSSKLEGGGVRIVTFRS
jgi:hypothetical protein